MCNPSSVASLRSLSVEGARSLTSAPVLTSPAFGWLARFLVLGALTCLWVGEGLADPPDAGVEESSPEQVGWHGEPLPEGLSRSDIEGEYLWEKDGATMVYVPPGAFSMGSEGSAQDEQPVRQVYLDGYYIDKYEVSWARWKRSGLPYSDHLGDRQRMPKPPDWGIVDTQPVLNVTWHDAVAYAGWAGKKLPTEAQWEKAARGTDGRTYPWGNDLPTFDHALWRDHPIAKESTADVDCCSAGASPYGALNMAGNVYEWCYDVYTKDFYATAPDHNPINEGPGRYRVLRGGAFVLEIEDLRSAYRYRLLPADRTPYIGFRTAVPGVPTP